MKICASMRAASWWKIGRMARLEQEFNSLAAQREACEAYIRSQQHEGWLLARNRYDDGGFSGGNLERPPDAPCWACWHVVCHLVPVRR